MTVGRAEIEAAASRVAGRVRRTPVMEVDLGEVAVVAKLELLQYTGSFKPRGAFNRILSEREMPSHVVAASGGNHGMAVAYAASVLGMRATVFVAGVTPEVKRRKIASYGADVRVEGHIYDDALEASRVFRDESGAIEIHAYDHPATVAGQGTVGREICEQVPDVNTVLVAVGGGGLIGGVAGWMRNDVKVVSVEPASIPAMERALAAGRPVDVEVSGVAADSLGARRIGGVPFEVAQRFVDQTVLVSDDEIVAAQRWWWDHARLVVEPGGATASAAILSGRYRFGKGERVAVLVCGANTDPAVVSGG